MTKLLALILACLALGLVAAGCGGDDDGDSGGDGGSSTADQPADTGGGAGAGGTKVSMKDIKFSPADVTVEAGEAITFTNDEAISHDVHKSSGPGEDFASGPSGGMQQGDTFELTLDTPGNYEYVCDVHAPGMAGTITVN